MRIAIDAHTLSGPPQGARTYVENMVREMALQAPKIEWLLFVDRLCERPEGWSENIRLVEWGGGRTYRLTIGARRQMHRWGCSVFHCTYFLPLIPVANPLVTIHDLLPETHPQFFPRGFALAARYGFRYSAYRARHVFVPSAYVRRTIIERYGLADDRVSITPCAVDFEHFHTGGRGDPAQVESSLRSQEYWLVVGRFDPRKDHRTVVGAYARLYARRRDIPRLVIAGSYGPSEAEIRGLIAGLGLENRILVLKNVPGVLLPMLYAHALATISASLGEGFGLPMIEAMAAGSPVICADNTAQTEVVKDAGLMFETACIDQLAAAMERLLDDRALREKLRDQGWTRARSYTWHRGAQVFLEQVRRCPVLGHEK